jgi:hypothetical protein
MLPLFCLRLSLGLLAALLPLRPAQLNPRFFRTHFLTVLGLAALALVLLAPVAGGGLIVCLGVAFVLAFLGSCAWSIEGHPGGRSLVVLTAAALGAGLWLAQGVAARPVAPALQAHAAGWLLADDLTSAALLGAATTAMLLGHSYLIAPNMSLTPLRRLLFGLYAALAARAALAGLGLYVWTRTHSLLNLTDGTVLWLPARWLLGLVLPLALGVMAWHTTRLRNTQSSTGILYIVVVFCFLGELTAQLVLQTTGYIL